MDRIMRLLAYEAILADWKHHYVTAGPLRFRLGINATQVRADLRSIGVRGITGEGFPVHPILSRVALIQGPERVAAMERAVALNATLTLMLNSFSTGKL